MRAVLLTLVLAVMVNGAARERALAAEPALEFGNYRALVIGNNDYKHIAKLKTAEADARAVAALLRERYGFKTELMLNATRYDIVTAFGRLRAETEPNDNVLIYYAGHGHLDRETQSGYWLPVDAEPDNEANWLAIESITRGLRAMPAKHVMVIADSCYSGTLVRAAPVGLKTGAERIAWLRRMAEKRTRTALVSGGLEPVMDGGGGGHSVFAKALLDTLRGNAEVLDGHGLFTQISRLVVVNAEQTPQYSDVRGAGHEGGEFLFVPLGATPLAGAAPAPASPGGSVARPEAEELFWRSISASDKASDYQAYLQAFPNGVFAPLARARVQQLAEPKPASAEPPARTAAPPAAPTPPPRPPTQVAAAVPSQQGFASSATKPGFKKGDSFSYQVIDGLAASLGPASAKVRKFTLTVSDVQNDIVTYTSRSDPTNGGSAPPVSGSGTADGYREDIGKGLLLSRWDGKGHRRYSPGVKLYEHPMRVGAQWENQYTVEHPDWTSVVVRRNRVIGVENVTVPAGSLAAIRIEATWDYNTVQTNSGKSGKGTGKETLWYSPEIGRFVASEIEEMSWSGTPPTGTIERKTRTELTSFKR